MSVLRTSGGKAANMHKIQLHVTSVYLRLYGKKTQYGNKMFKISLRPCFRVNTRWFIVLTEKAQGMEYHWFLLHEYHWFVDSIN